MLCKALNPLLIDPRQQKDTLRAKPLRHTRPYPGVSELIGRLRARGVRLAVLSNKPHELTVRFVQSFWSDDCFDFIQGYVEEDDE